LSQSCRLRKNEAFSLQALRLFTYCTDQYLPSTAGRFTETKIRGINKDERPRQSYLVIVLAWKLVDVYPVTYLFVV
jgi:hypothetical protein